jgi:hypothetical protein
MRTGRGNRSTRRKPASGQLFPPQISRDLPVIEPGMQRWESGDCWGFRLLQITPLMFPSTSFPIHYTLIILSSGSTRIIYFPIIRHGPHRKRRVQQFCCFMCIRCRCNIFTEPLPSNDRMDTYTDTDWWEGFMKCAVETGSAAMIL